MRAVSASSLTTTILFQVILSLVVVSAFNFTFSSSPTQCSSLTVNVNGGTPPYRLNLIPAGPMPGGPPEIRSIVDASFSDKTFNLDALKFPADSQFIAMVSDATGVGKGGTSAILRVSDSNNTSCLSTAKQGQSFNFTLEPDTISLCQPVNISWYPPIGNVTLDVVIPRGESFKIDVLPNATSISWLPPVEPGTKIFILAGDSQGNATGGSSSSRVVLDGSRACLSGSGDAYSVTESPFTGQVSSTSLDISAKSPGMSATSPDMSSNSPDMSTTCLDMSSTSPDMSSASPGMSATSPPDKSSDNSEGIKSPLVIGITAGLLPFSALASALLYLRYRKRHRHNKVDLWKDNDSYEPVNALEPTPFPPHPHRGSGRGSFEGNGYRYSSSAFQSGPPQTPIGYPSSYYHDRPPSHYVSHGALSPLAAFSNTWGDSRTDMGTHVTTLSDGGRPQAPARLSVMNPDGGGPVVGGSGWRESRKPPPPRTRPVSFLQHQDAGTAELVELPPSYVDLGKSLPPIPPLLLLPPR